MDNCIDWNRLFAIIQIENCVQELSQLTQFSIIVLCFRQLFRQKTELIMWISYSFLCGPFTINKINAY